MRLDVENHFSKPEGLVEVFFYLYPPFLVDPPFITEWIWQAKSEQNHGFRLHSSILFGLWKSVLYYVIYQVYIDCLKVFVLHLVLLFAPFSLRRLLVSSCLCVLTVPAIMLPHTHTHTCRVDSPHPSQTDTGRAQHDIQTAPRAMHWGASTFMLPSCTNTHTCTRTMTRTAWHVQEASTQTHIVQCIKICRRTHWGTLLDHPIWRLEATRKTKHLQRQRGGGVGGQTGRLVWWGCDGRGREGTPQEEREWRVGGRKSLMCWDAPVADLVLPPLIYPDRSLCVILHWLCGSLAPT